MDQCLVVDAARGGARSEDGGHALTLLGFSSRAPNIQRDTQTWECPDNAPVHVHLYTYLFPLHTLLRTVYHSQGFYK